MSLCCVSGDVSGVMQSVADLAAEPFTPSSEDATKGCHHIVDHFNGHRILKQLIYNDVKRMKQSEETGKSFTSLSNIVSPDSYLHNVCVCTSYQTPLSCHYGTEVAHFVNHGGCNISFKSIVLSTKLHV